MVNWSRLAWKGTKAYAKGMVKSQIGMSAVLYGLSRGASGASGGGGRGLSAAEQRAVDAAQREGWLWQERKMTAFDAEATKQNLWFRQWIVWAESSGSIPKAKIKEATRIQKKLCSVQIDVYVLFDVPGCFTAGAGDRCERRIDAVRKRAKKFLAWWEAGRKELVNASLAKMDAQTNAAMDAGDWRLAERIMVEWAERAERADRIGITN